MNIFLRIFFLIIAFLFCFIGVLFFEVSEILLRVFPLDNPEAVLFTLTHNVSGANNVFFILLDPKLSISIENTLFMFSLVGLIVIITILVMSKKGLFGLNQENLTLCRLLFMAYYPSFISILFVGLVFWGLALSKFPLANYVSAYGSFLFEKTKENPLFDSDYVYPDSVRISFKEKRNLILVMLESMEYNFQDSVNGGNLSQNQIPEISDLMNRNVSFKPGGKTVYGTGWTMGETVAKTCALPLIMPVDGNSNGVKDFLKNAICLTDILYQNGYTVVNVQGTWRSFASMNCFLESHNVVGEHIFDMVYFKKKGYSISDTSFFHSLSDRELYAETQEIIEKLNNGDDHNPWALLFFTMDTHGPYGRLDSSCIDETNVGIKKEDQYPSVLRCASKQLEAFLLWASTRPWFEKTTIAVMGDHPAMVAPEVVGFKNDKIEHYWLNFFINSVLPQPKKNRIFTSFDMYPTMLEAMGGEIEGRALGLGRSLFSDQETLIEKYGKDSLNVFISRKGDVYNRFWR